MEMLEAAPTAEQTNRQSFVLFVSFIRAWTFGNKLVSIRFWQRHCKQEKAKLWLHYKPSLFQHIGTTSSLKGKVQKLKDKQFGKIPTFYPHPNPPALVKSPIAPYKSHTLTRAYAGETFFWGLLPQPGDFIEIIFHEPYNLKRYVPSCSHSNRKENKNENFNSHSVRCRQISIP